MQDHHAAGNSGLRRGGPNGDLYVLIGIRESEIFERDGQELGVDVPVSPVLAALGGSVEVPTPDGAATLRLLNRLFGIHACADTLCEIGATVGADIPFCPSARNSRTPGFASGATATVTSMLWFSDGEACRRLGRI